MWRLGVAAGRKLKSSTELCQRLLSGGNWYIQAQAAPRRGSLSSPTSSGGTRRSAHPARGPRVPSTSLSSRRFSDFSLPFLTVTFQYCTQTCAHSYFSPSAAKKESPKTAFHLIPWVDEDPPLFISEDRSLLESPQTTSPAFLPRRRRRENQHNA